MREELGVLLMENESGDISVQLYANATEARKSFEQLAGRLGDPPSRATFLELDYKAKSVKADCKNLPVRTNKDETPDAWVIGQGPINFPEGEDNENQH